METKSVVRKLLEEKNKEYAEILRQESPEAISRVLIFFEKARRDVKSNKRISLNEEIEKLDEDSRRIIDLMDRYKRDIKQIFIESGEMITHITTVPPEKLIGGKIMRSRSRANNYETEVGDWVFASSEPVDATNAYIARKPGTGMICITPELYIFGGNNIEVINGRAVLKEPNYIYTINPQNFTPVVALIRDVDGIPSFEFSEEWTSEYDVDIKDKNQVTKVTEVSDITELVKNIHVLCDVHMAGIGLKMLRSGNKSVAIDLLIESVRNGLLRYINGECKINIHSQIEEVRPTLDINMNLDEFESKRDEILAKYNERLKTLEPLQIRMYKLLVSFEKTKNSFMLNGSFRRDLGAEKTPEEKEKLAREYKTKIDEILKEVQSLVGENVNQDNLEQVLVENSRNVFGVLRECSEELKQVAQEVGLKIHSSIYVSPKDLIDGKLQTSKDVLNVNGELGNWVFAQSGKLVDNPYLLRKSGKGVFYNGEFCLPGTPELVKARNGRAILTNPVYTYLMKTDKFEPVISVEYMPNGNPGIYFDGEWTSDQEINLSEMTVKKFNDVTEMLYSMGILSAKDSESFQKVISLLGEKKLDELASLIQDKKLHYINGECGINANPELVLKGRRIGDE